MNSSVSLAADKSARQVRSGQFSSRLVGRSNRSGQSIGHSDIQTVRQVRSGPVSQSVGQFVRSGHSVGRSVCLCVSRSVGQSVGLKSVSQSVDPSGRRHHQSVPGPVHPGGGVGPAWSPVVRGS